MIHTPHVDWFALSPELALLGVASIGLLALSAWPAAISHHSFGGNRATTDVKAGFSRQVASSSLVTSQQRMVAEEQK